MKTNVTDQQPTENFLSYFKPLKDPRTNNANMRHELSDILLLTVLAVICGAEGWTDVERFGKPKEPLLKDLLTLPNGIPSHDILGDLFSKICPDTFQSCFMN